MTEQEKMLAGKLYDPSDKVLAALRAKAHELCQAYNHLPETDEKRIEIIKELGIAGTDLYLQGPIQFDYGCFTSIGARFYANFNFTCLDCCPVTIGDDVFFGPNVSLLTPMHPLRWQERNMYTKPDGRNRPAIQSGIRQTHHHWQQLLACRKRNRMRWRYHR